MTPVLMHVLSASAGLLVLNGYSMLCIYSVCFALQLLVLDLLFLFCYRIWSILLMTILRVDRVHLRVDLTLALPHPSRQAVQSSQNVA